MRLIILLAIASLASAECIPVSGDRILVRDIAAVNPAFLALPQNTVVGFAPLPGAVRVFSHTELGSFARAHQIAAGDSKEVCFSVARPELLKGTDAAAAMRAVLPKEALLVVEEVSRMPVPQGAVVFPLESLEPPQPTDPAVQMWKGFVTYAGTRRQPVWARVRITVDRPVLLATRQLRAGEQLSSAAFTLSHQAGPMKREPFVGSLEEVNGRTLLRAVKEGEALSSSALAPPLAAHRGDAVKVEVVNGSTRLFLSAVAETNGFLGQPIQLRNPSTGKTFRARLIKTQTAMITVGQLP